MAADGRITFDEAINLGFQFAVQNVKLHYLLIYLKKPLIFPSSCMLFKKI